MAGPRMNAVEEQASSLERYTLRSSAGTKSPITLRIKEKGKEGRLHENQSAGEEARQCSPNNQRPHGIGASLENGAYGSQNAAIDYRYPGPTE